MVDLRSDYLKEGLKIIVICLAKLGVIFLLRKSEVIFYSPLSLQTRVAHITAQGNITHKVHITRRKANRVGAPAIKQVRQLYSPAESDMHFVRDIAFGSDMRYARLKQQRRIEYHCDHREQYHFCEAKISR